MGDILLVWKGNKFFIYNEEMEELYSQEIEYVISDLAYSQELEVLAIASEKGVCLQELTPDGVVRDSVFYDITDDEDGGSWKDSSHCSWFKEKKDEK